MNRRELSALVGGATAFAAAACLPLLSSGYWLSIGVSIAMYTVLATSWALFSGPTHYISLATAAFFGVGMYVVGGGVGALPFPALVLLAAVAGAGFAAIVGLMSLAQTTLGTSSGL